MVSGRQRRLQTAFSRTYLLTSVKAAWLQLGHVIVVRMRSKVYRALRGRTLSDRDISKLLYLQLWSKSSSCKQTEH